MRVIFYILGGIYAIICGFYTPSTTDKITSQNPKFYDYVVGFIVTLVYFPVAFTKTLIGSIKFF